MDSTFRSHFLVDWKESLQMKIGNAHLPMSFKLECIRAAKLIEEQSAGRPIYLAMSGGLDSECMAIAFMEAQVTFRAIIMRFSGDLNSHDICTALDFCRDQKIEPLIIDLDLLNFLNSGKYLRFAEEYRCSSPQIATHLWLAERCPGIFVFSGSPLRGKLSGSIGFDPFSSNYQFFKSVQFMDLPKENQAAFELFSILSNRGIGNFFLYTPELIVASLIEQNIVLSSHLMGRDDEFLNSKELFENEFSQTLFSGWLAKFRFYIEAGFLVRPRANKFTGFEKVHQYFANQDGNASSTRKDSIIGLQKFNERYRVPMQKIAGITPEVRFEFGDENRNFLAAKWLQRIEATSHRPMT